jgi:hypothetical protein
MVIIMLNEYAKEREAPSECQGRLDVCNKDAGMCVTWARTSQRRTALICAASGGRTACVQALVAAKADLDIKDVSDARLLACPITFESPSTSKSHKHLLLFRALLWMCLCVYEQ